MEKCLLEMEAVKQKSRRAKQGQIWQNTASGFAKALGGRFFDSLKIVGCMCAGTGSEPERSGPKNTKHGFSTLDYTGKNRASQ